MRVSMSEEHMNCLQPAEDKKLNREPMPMTEEEKDLIEKKIRAFADSAAPLDPHTEEERLLSKIGDGTTVGGCTVNVHARGRAVLAVLWVEGQHRGHGLGSMLLRAAENAARERDCYYLCLSTEDYMARPFYEKHGYRVFTVHNDLPPGHTCWSLSKRLDKAAPDYIPTDNTGERRYQIKPGSKEDAAYIREEFNRFCVEVVPDRHEYIRLNKKLTDETGGLIAAAVAGIYGDDTAVLPGIWVDERYRGRGIGSYLLGEIEREAKEKGAYVILSYACDWASGFFFKNGFVSCGGLEDYPRGHTAHELEKRL